MRLWQILWPPMRLAHLAILILLAKDVARAEDFYWEKLPSIPDQHGFAGAFAGVSNGALIVAGGANFPSRPPWENGSKVWHNSIFVLEAGSDKWKHVHGLPHALGYGVSVSYKNSVFCIGGNDATRQYSDVFSISWKNGELEYADHPSFGLGANGCGAIVGDRIFIAGGIHETTTNEAPSRFVSFNLNATNRGLGPIPRGCPGKGRTQATAGVLDGWFYLIGGAALESHGSGTPIRKGLRDCYRFKPGEGWKQIADLPTTVVAAPSPAFSANGKLYVFGGDDLSQVSRHPTEHKGFSKTILAYDPAADRWSKAGETPFALVTTTAVQWNDRIIIPGGEVRPGVRSTEVWAGSLK